MTVPVGEDSKLSVIPGVSVGKGDFQPNRTFRSDRTTFFCVREPFGSALSWIAELLLVGVE